MPATAGEWINSLWSSRAWDDEDAAGRIATAFDTLVRTRQRWPVPVHFLEALPRLVATAPEAPQRRSEGDNALARQHIAEAIAKLRLSTDPDEPPTELRMEERAE